MERLTFDGNFCDIAQCKELPCQHGGSCTQRKVWEKLKAYEDIGLEPEEVNDAVVGAKLMAKAKLVSAFGVAAERLRELAEADKDARVVVLSCKVGDTVWMYGEDFGTVLPYTIDLISLVDKVCGYSANCNHNGELLDGIDFEDDDIGKTVFLTREDVEKELEAKRDVCP